MAARRLVAILENKLSAITPDQIAGLSQNFSHRYIYIVRIHNTGVSN
jgi:hypothetical protein